MSPDLTGADIFFLTASLFMVVMGVEHFVKVFVRGLRGSRR